MEENKGWVFQGVSANGWPPSANNFRINEEKGGEWDLAKAILGTHTIRDENDFQAHCDYIHYNPVKHSYVQTPSERPHSSFGRFANAGLYDNSWGNMQSPELTENIGGNEVFKKGGFTNPAR